MHSESIKVNQVRYLFLIWQRVLRGSNKLPGIVSAGNVRYLICMLYVYVWGHMYWIMLSAMLQHHCSSTFNRNHGNNYAHRRVNCWYAFDPVPFFWSPRSKTFPVIHAYHLITYQCCFCKRDNFSLIDCVFLFIFCLCRKLPIMFTWSWRWVFLCNALRHRWDCPVRSWLPSINMSFMPVRCYIIAGWPAIFYVLYTNVEHMIN